MCFLLCSDGLSDYDRVEEYWNLKIAPILTQEKDLCQMGKELINIANNKNGHDNVTISLFYCQIKLSSLEPTPLSIASIKADIENAKEEIKPSIDRSDDLPSDLQPTEPLPSTEEKPLKKPNPLLIVGILGILVISVGAYGLWKLLQPPPTPTIPPTPPSPSPSITPPPPPSPESSLPKPGTIIQLTVTLSLWKTPEGDQLIEEVPVETVLQILSQEDSEKDIKIKVCQLPTETNLKSPSLQELEGKEAWIPTTNLQPSVYQTYEGEKVGSCETTIMLD
ncbi:hypothetical protein CWATWH0401_2966 [Crocosphaera watsonii WH 0401]|uniref:Uncharacterized protein n=1 Tax=Crocosphaera watsonii WH 0401 TaxID=555881 RepID=T2J7F6_CROWT|nr:hypothetical protein CWATWH0401_2966 [Crocosphaera watsonii WH 0401]